MGSIYDNSYNNVLQAEGAAPKEMGLIAVKVGDKASIGIFPVIFSNAGLQFQEKVQVMEAFNEHSHINAYGKRPQNLQLSGHIFSVSGANPNLTKTSELLTKYYQEVMRAFVAAQSGKFVTVSCFGHTFTGLVVDYNLQQEASMTSVVNFSMNMVSVDPVLKMAPVQGGNVPPGTSVTTNSSDTTATGETASDNFTDAEIESMWSASFKWVDDIIAGR